MNNIESYILILVFIDYSISMIQLLFAKFLPIEWYSDRAIYGRWVYNIGYVFSVDEPFHAHYNPIFYDSIEQARSQIDFEIKNNFTIKCKSLTKVFQKLKVITNEFKY